MSNWREVSDDEALELRQHMLDGADLSSAGVAQLRKDFNAASAEALGALARHLGRLPTQVEADNLHAALVEHFNSERIPLLPREIVH